MSRSSVQTHGLTMFANRPNLKLLELQFRIELLAIFVFIIPRNDDEKEARASKDLNERHEGLNERSHSAVNLNAFATYLNSFQTSESQVSDCPSCSLERQPFELLPVDAPVAESFSPKLNFSGRLSAHSSQFIRG